MSDFPINPPINSDPKNSQFVLHETVIDLRLDFPSDRISISPNTSLNAYKIEEDEAQIKTLKDLQKRSAFHVNQDETPFVEQYRVAGFETHGLLNLYGVTLEVLLKKASLKGARIMQCTQLLRSYNPKTKQYTYTSNTNEGGLKLNPNITILPACHEGRNRSQIMHLILSPFTDHLVAPHGSNWSIDPLFVPLSQDMCRYYQLRDIEEGHDRYRQATGHSRIPRLGYKELAQKLSLPSAECVDTQWLKSEINTNVNLDLIQTLKDIMNNIYLKMIHEGGQIIVFERALHIMLYRFTNLAAIHNLSLSKLTFIPIQADDPIFCGAQAMKAFKNMLEFIISWQE